MVIQATPNIEPAQAGVPQVQERRQEDGTEEAQKAKPDKNGLGAFAKILSGLLKKTGAGEGVAADAHAHANAKNSDPLAEIAETGELGTVSGKGRGVRIGKAAVSEKTTEKLKKGEAGPEPSSKLSEHEKNVLLAVGRLAGQKDELSPKETEGEAVLKGLSGDLRRNKQETVKTETAFAQKTPGEASKQPITTSSAAIALGEVDENAKAAAEKAKNRINIGDAAAKNRIAAHNNHELQKPDLKKTASGSEKEGKSKLEEARAKRRGLGFDVQDFRTHESAAKTGETNIRVGAESRVQGDLSSKEITLELRLPNNAPEASSANAAATTSWEARSSQSFEDMLARELHQNFNNDIVRHASIALRDGGEGTIRLALKPETLGNVKIRLEMAENRVTGHIIVESEEALRAFEREISSLEKAFRDSGFEGANLEMSLAADGRDADQNWQEAETSRFMPEYAAASQYDAAQAEMPFTLDFYQQGAGAINVLV